MPGMSACMEIQSPFIWLVIWFDLGVVALAVVLASVDIEPRRRSRIKADY